MSTPTAINTVPAERKPIEDMTQKEMTVEILETMRGVSDALQALSQNPMLMALMPKGMRL